MIACSPVNKKLWFFCSCILFGLIFSLFFVFLFFALFAFLYFTKGEYIYTLLGKFNGTSSFSVDCCTCVTSKIAAIRNHQNALPNSNISISFIYHDEHWTHVNNAHAYRVNFLLLSKQNISILHTQVKYTFYRLQQHVCIQVTFQNSTSNQVLIYAQDFSA